MYEDFGTIINKGFHSWIRNLNICIPFILDTLFTVVLLILFFIMIVFLIVISNSGPISDPASLSDTELLSMVSKGLTGNILLSVIMIVVFVLIGIFIHSFFSAGAIGMAKKASETGDTVLSDMIVSGSKNAFRLFLTILLMGLLLLVGIVFIVPGALTIGDLRIIFENPNALPPTGAIVLALGIISWTLYVTILSIVLSFTSYALVIDELEPLEALRAGFRFFMENKWDVFFVWVISMGLTIINGSVGSYDGNSILVSALTSLIPIIIIQPLITVLFTRLYVSRKGKKLYDPVDLLSVPDRF